jgi:hypothetical protein
MSGVTIATATTTATNTNTGSLMTATSTTPPTTAATNVTIPKANRELFAEAAGKKDADSEYEPDAMQLGELGASPSKASRSYGYSTTVTRNSSLNSSLSSTHSHSSVSPMRVGFGEKDGENVSYSTWRDDYEPTPAATRCVPSFTFVALTADNTMIV